MSSELHSVLTYIYTELYLVGLTVYQLILRIMLKDWIGQLLQKRCALSMLDLF